MTRIETKHLQALIEQNTQDMTGKVAAVTGTTSGTGYVCARELARLGARVLLLNRPSARSEAALARLREEVPEGKFDPIACDLQDFSSVRAAARAIREKTEVLDVLCNNAGVMALPDRATKDGYDVQMQTNAISPFLLTSELFELLSKSREARIVNHTSMARLGPPLEPKYFSPQGGDLGGDGTEEENSSFQGPRWVRYHQTKLANCAFTYGLKRELEERGISHIKVLLAHPGLAATGLQATTAETGGMDVDSPFMQNAQSAEDGALGILRACTDPEAKSGDFFGPELWAGYPERIAPEDSLSEPGNLSVFWQGCEAAVGPFAFSAGSGSEAAHGGARR
jgi:NAD(P)-dependent dehydrogenase (short-subunit alcohol dehydrogenase family)